MDKKTIQTYNQLAKEYDDETKDFWERFPVGFIEKFAKKINNGFVLDVGSGPGRDAELLKRQGLDVICLDASQPMIDQTITKGFPSILTDFMKLPFNSNVFSGVWTYTTLLHVPKKQLPKALKEIHRVLKADGVLGIGLIEGSEELYRQSSGMDMERFFAFYEKDELENALKKAGFSIIHFQEFLPGKRKYLNFIARKL